MERVVLVFMGVVGLLVLRRALSAERPRLRAGERKGTGFIDWMIENVAYSDVAGGALPLGLFFITCIASVATGLLGY